jgi:hypothetical protein
MKARFLLLSAALAAAAAAGGYHWKTVHACSRLESERLRVLSDAAQQRRVAEETSRQVAVAQRELQALLVDHLNRPASAAARGPRSSAASGTPPAQPKPGVVSPNPELRRLQVQAYVSDQRLRFAALLNRLGFSTEKLQAFDRIHASCQQMLVDDSQPDAARRQAREARDVQLQELFGPNYAQWVDANRNDPVRAIVGQIVQQTFQSSGALTTAQAEELTRIVAQHRINAPKEAGQPGYDWNRIINDAQSILADRQREDFIAAIEYRRASDKMSVMAAKGKR